MLYARVSWLLLSFSLIPLTPSTVLAEQPVPRPSLQQSPPSRLIPPRPFTVNKETMDRLASTSPKAPGALTGREQQALREIAEQIKAHDTLSAKNGWSALVTTLNRKGTPADVNELIQFVLHEAYLQSNEELKNYADKVKRFNEEKKRVRNEIADLRDRIARECTGKPKPPPGKPPIPPDPDAVKCEGLAKSLREREGRLSRLDDDGQLANIDLQNALQRQQQLLQMISNLAKQMHDTAMAVIRKIGG